MMQKGDYKKILFQVFDEFEFSESEKQLALEDFKKKLAFELFASVKDELSGEEQAWVEKHLDRVDPQDPKILEIQNAIRALYTPDVLEAKTRPLFKHMLSGYIDFMSRELGLSEEKKIGLKGKVHEF